MGQAFLYGNGGGSGTGGILTVTAPAGDTVTISKDGKTKTKTADSSGKAVFKNLKAGAWTVTITNGSQTATKTVNVVTDYAVTMTYFSATIAATWPEGSTCTCSDGSTTLTAPNTSGSHTFTVPNAGTWTVSCADGSDSDTETVSITTDGESKSVELRYWDGVMYSTNAAYRGSWIAKEWKSSAESGNAVTPTFSISNGISVSVNGTDANSSVYNDEKINFAGYKTLRVAIKEEVILKAITIGITDELKNTYTFVASSKIAEKSTAGEYTVDLTNVNITGYVIFNFNNGAGANTATVTNVKIE